MRTPLILTGLILFGCVGFSSAATLDAALLKKTHAPLKRTVNGRVFDLAPLIDWYVDDYALSRQAPHLRKQRPTQYADWAFIDGTVLAATNGMTYMKLKSFSFIAVKNFKKAKVGDWFPFLAYNLRYTRPDHVNGVVSSWLAFDFGTEAR